MDKNVGHSQHTFTLYLYSVQLYCNIVVTDKIIVVSFLLLRTLYMVAQKSNLYTLVDIQQSRRMDAWQYRLFQTAAHLNSVTTLPCKVLIFFKHCINWKYTPSAKFLETFGRLIVFFGRYSASRKFLGRLRPAFFRRIFGLFRLIMAVVASWQWAPSKTSAVGWPQGRHLVKKCASNSETTSGKV